MAFVSVNGTDLYYESHGTGPVLVFLHGAGGNHLSWWQQVPAFRERYRCITIDHRGFGRSPDRTGEGRARFVDDLEGLLSALAIDRAALVAQSMGGRTAIGFSVRHPTRVSALVMADTWGFFKWRELHEKMRRLREQQADAGAALTTRALGRTFQSRDPARTFLYRQIFQQNPPSESRNSRPDPHAPTKAEVAALPVATLFIVGSEDGITPPAVIREAHALIRGAEFREFAGCGHSVYFEDPEGFNAAVRTFLAKHA